MSRVRPAALQVLRDLPGMLLLESTLQRGSSGRYSFLTADPFCWFEVQTPRFGEDPFANVAADLAQWQADSQPDLPPFQGGAAGLIGYELAAAWERLPFAFVDEFQLPQLAIGIYDWVIAWDHDQQRAWIISHGFPAMGPQQTDRAATRLQSVKDRLNAAPAVSEPTAPRDGFECVDVDSQQRQVLQGHAGFYSDFSRAQYLRTVERVIEYTRAGDIFQANLSQRILHPLAAEDADPVSLYCRLRESNPAPFAGYFQNEDWAVLSSSPERFVRVWPDGRVETRPIKGTRQRHAFPEADLFTRDELQASGKDCAENVMIVDLLRNDLSRVCSPGSFTIPALCRTEMFETVQHLVSIIRAQLADEYSLWDLLRATIPGGSITGAPKIRAMEIIAELEPTVRGPYCGNLFYMGFDGQFDSNILIRTLIQRRGWVQCSAGGGIVAQSDPVSEYEETLHKAAGMMAALTQK